MPIEHDDELREILGLDTVAVVGCSTSPEKEAHKIPAYLIEQGYEVIPVNPFADEIFGRKAYDSLSEVPDVVDIVDVFRPSDEVSDIVDEAIAREDVAVVWTQLGIRNDAAAKRAEQSGKRVIQDKCMKIEHERVM